MYRETVFTLKFLMGLFNASNGNRKCMALLEISDQVEMRVLPFTNSFYVKVAFFSLSSSIISYLNCLCHDIYNNNTKKCTILLKLPPV